MANTPTRPRPVPDAVSAFHWAAAAQGRLDIQRCTACGTWQYPPTVACTNCLDGEVAPTTVSGAGTIYSFAVVRQPFDAGFVDAVPYVVALVALAEDPGVRLLTNIVDIEPELVEMGMAVEVVFEPLGDGALPQFRPVGSRGQNTGGDDAE